MKRKIFTFGFLILSIFVGPITPLLAGHPDEDRVVSQMREDFKGGSLPSLEEVRLNEMWFCEIRNAVRGQTMKDEDVALLKFEINPQNENSLINTEEEGENKVYLFLAGKPQSLFLDASKEEFPHFVGVRSTSAGELLVEVSTVFKKVNDDKAENSIAFGSFSDSENIYKAFIYARCVTK